MIWMKETEAAQLAATRQQDDDSQLGVALFGELELGSGDFYVSGAIAQSDSRAIRFSISISGTQTCLVRDDSEPDLAAQVSRMMAWPVSLEFQLRGLEAMAELGPIGLRVDPI